MAIKYRDNEELEATVEGLGSWPHPLTVYTAGHILMAIYIDFS